MNRSGIIFTVMTLFMILAVFSLNSTIKELSAETQSIEEIAALSAVSNKAENIERAIIDLSNEAVVSEISERILPFEYTLENDMNYIEIKQQLPLRPLNYQEIFNAVNMFGVFLEDSDRTNVFDGLAVDVNTVQNSNWGGTHDTVSFLVEPFCYNLKVKGINTVLLGGSGNEKCEHEFQNSYFKRLDLHVTIKTSSEDFNSISCTMGTCPQDEFSAASSLPYYHIEIDDSDCSNCVLSQKVVSQHFNPSTDFNIMVSCVGAACTSAPIIISHSELDFNVFHESNHRLEINAKTTFSDAIDRFYFEDFNVRVRHADLNAVKANN